MTTEDRRLTERNLGISLGKKLYAQWVPRSIKIKQKHI